MTLQDRTVDGGGEVREPTRRWWHYFRYEEPSYPPLEYTQPQAPIPRRLRFGHIPFETLARIPSEQYVQMYRDAQLHTGRHWLPGTCFGVLAFLGFVLMVIAPKAGWPMMLISMAFPLYMATHRAIMQSYLEGRLHEAPHNNHMQRAGSP